MLKKSRQRVFTRHLAPEIPLCAGAPNSIPQPIHLIRAGFLSFHNPHPLMRHARPGDLLSS